MASFFSFHKCYDRLLCSALAKRKTLHRNRCLLGAHGARKSIRLWLEELESRLAPATTLAIADAAALEPVPHGSATLNFTVTRTGDLSSQVTVGYQTAAGTALPATDFTPQSGTTTFAAGSA